MGRYVAVVWFKNGMKREYGSTTDRAQAERIGAQMFEQEMRSAPGDMLKPTRYEVVEKK